MTAALRVNVFDYGAGNMHSLLKALAVPNVALTVESDMSRLAHNADAVVLPGVGAFAPAAQRMASGLGVFRDALQRGMPCLGICLGMQLLFEGSTEGPGEGLGVFPGQVTRLRAARVPQIGWNAIEPTEQTDSLFAESQLRSAYYANSFVARPSASQSSSVIAWSDHEGDRFPAAVRAGHVIGAQFHPEKSSAPGVRFVRAFLAEALEARQ